MKTSVICMVWCTTLLALGKCMLAYFFLQFTFIFVFIFTIKKAQSKLGVMAIKIRINKGYLQG